MSPPQLAYAQKRRSTRIYNAIPLAIQGSDAFRAPYLEEVATLTVNCHGCRYRSNYEAIQGDTVYLEVKQSREGSATYSCQAQVKWVQRLVTKDSRFEIAVELAAPGNIWGIVSPPHDWFPIQVPKAIDRGSIRREQPPATRFEQPMMPILNEESAQFSHLERDDLTTTPPPSIAGGVMEQAKLFGRRVRAIRTAARITQKQIAERAQVNPKYLAELERGEKKPSFDALVALARVLGVPPAAFFQFDRKDSDETALRKKIDSLLDGCATHELNQIYRIAKALKGP